MPLWGKSCRPSLEGDRIVLQIALKQFCDYSGYKMQKRVLKDPAGFYAALAKKMLVRSGSGEVLLNLKDGRVVPVMDFMTLYIFREIFVDGCYDISIDAEAPMILDVGANTGLFALRMKQLFPEASICCYEPFPGNFRKLERLVEINSLCDVRCFKKAVGGRAREGRLHVHQSNIGGHSLSEELVSGGESVQVEVVPLSEILREISGAVDFMKLDCEGSEFEILMSMEKPEAERIRKIVVEMTPSLYDADRLFAHMKSLGYLRSDHSGLPIFSHP